MIIKIEVEKCMIHEINQDVTDTIYLGYKLNSARYRNGGAIVKKANIFPYH